MENNDIINIMEICKLEIESIDPRKDSQPLHELNNKWIEQSPYSWSPAADSRIRTFMYNNACSLESKKDINILLDDLVRGTNFRFLSAERKSRFIKRVITRMIEFAEKARAWGLMCKGPEPTLSDLFQRLWLRRHSQWAPRTAPGAYSKDESPIAGQKVVYDVPLLASSTHETCGVVSSKRELETQLRAQREEEKLWSQAYMTLERQQLGDHLCNMQASTTLISPSKPASQPKGKEKTLILPAITAKTERTNNSSRSNAFRKVSQPPKVLAQGQENKKPNIQNQQHQIESLLLLQTPKASSPTPTSKTICSSPTTAVNQPLALTATSPPPGLDIGTLSVSEFFDLYSDAFNIPLQNLSQLIFKVRIWCGTTTIRVDRGNEEDWSNFTRYTSTLYGLLSDKDMEKGVEILVLDGAVSSG